MQTFIALLFISIAALSSTIAVWGPTTAAARAQSIFKPVNDLESEGWTLFPTEQQSFLTDLLSANIVIIGERHGRKAHQDIEARLLRAFAFADRRPSVVLEMLKPEQMQTVLDHRTKNPLNASGLGIALQWWDTGWPAWSYYQPVFQAAYDANLPIFPADLNSGIAYQVESDSGSKRVSTRTSTIPVLDPAFQLDPVAEIYVKDSWTDAMRQAHCDLINDNRLAEVTALQIARDQSMAFSALQALSLNPDQPVVLIVGSSHARMDRSVPLYLARTLPQLKVITLALMETDTPEQPSSNLLIPLSSTTTAPFDYVWQTTKIESEDQCAKLRELFGRN